MANASFVQTNFSGGEFSSDAQGRFSDPAYKTALNVCLNAFPTETGAWTRRPGFRYSQHTKTGHPAVLRPFDFTVTQPYQMEFTANFLRFFAGLSLLTTTDAPYVETIDTATPAKVFLAGPCPADWANGNTVVFTINSDPCAGPLLCGRQFVIGNVSTANGTFTLADPITGASINGATLAYTPGTALDQVRKVHELATPYTAAQLADIRTVQDQTSVLLLHGSYQPRLVNAGTSPAPFQIAAQNFADGPYLDAPGSEETPNTTTLTPSGVSGSVTVTASATTNINGGSGFQTTDIGRLIRFRGDPVDWDNGDTYAKEAIVIGTDDNIYKSLIGSNTGNDPTTDDGTKWQITDQTVTWTWMRITARATTTSVTATILGADLPDNSSSLHWQLGLYSDTTGWPTSGAYHDGRLWLTSTAFPNRVDNSVSNEYFNFSPSGIDGTVADNNAVAAVFNANDANAIYWLLSTDDGLMCGTQGGVRRVKASVLDDPLSPSNIQERRVDTYGCAKVDPVQPGGQTVYVQRQGRKVLAAWQASVARYTAENITYKADHLTGVGISEIGWQQEPSLNLWLRKADNTLAGCVYQRNGFGNKAAQGEEDLNGFHRVTLGSGREVEAISTGPSFEGLSDTLYVVTNKTDSDDPDYNIRWVECLMPPFDAASDVCDAFFVDAGANACCATIMQTINGDSFNGIRIYGLWYANGLSVAAYVGGMDVGDFTVTSGYIDVPFTATFTLAYVQSLDECALFGSEASSTVTTTFTPATAANSLTALVGAATPVGYQTFGGDIVPDHAGDRVFQLEQGPATGSTGLKLLRAADGLELAQATEVTTFGAGPAHAYGSATVPVYIPGANVICCSVDTGNSSAFATIKGTTLVARSVIGVHGTGFAGSTPTQIATSFGGCAAQTSAKNFVVTMGETGAGFINEVAVLDLSFTTPSLVYAVNISDDVGYACQGKKAEAGTFYVLGRDFDDFNVALSLYEYRINGSTVTRRTIGTIAPTTLDATWTNWSPKQPGYDKKDGNLVCIAVTGDAVTNKYYLFKVNVLTGAIMWKTAVPVSVANARLDLCSMNGKLGAFDNTGKLAYIYDLSTGTSTTQTWNAGLAATLVQYFDYATGSITMNCSYAQSTGPIPTYIGTYLANNGNVIPSFRWGRIFLGTTYTERVTTDYPIFGAIGFTYNSDGQLLEPDAGADAGAQNGPAFGKTRRLHRYAMKLARSRGVSIGTDFTHLRPVPLTTAGGTTISAPTLFSDTATDVIESDYDLHGRIAWRISRPYPCTVTALGGFIASADR